MSPILCMSVSNEKSRVINENLLIFSMIFPSDISAFLHR
jgi:hypothetical protein